MPDSQSSTRGRSTAPSTADTTYSPNGAAAPASEPLLTTDLDNMHVFVSRIAYDRLRFVHEWGWLSWDGKRWARDKSGAAWRCVKLLSLAWTGLALEAEGAGLTERAKDFHAWAARCRQRSRLQATLQLAESDKAIVQRPEDFDTDQDAFNTQSGTLHLLSGREFPYFREDLITKLAGTRYDPAAAAPAWTAFLERILPDAELRSFVQRAVGYSLTGHTSEQCWFLLHGTGANGKTTFLRVVSELLGDYATYARPETFMVAEQDGIPNDIAALAGARLVVSTETEDGQRLAESLVKQLTGGDKMTARFLHREFFTFTPRLKLWLACNHLPGIRGTDHAIWRRTKLVPFSVTIPDAEQNPGLADQLLNELPGILNWALAGYEAWRSRGLAAPAAVMAAVDRYRSEQDVIGSFIEDRCVLTPAATIAKGELFEAYVNWAEANNERAWSQTRFSLRLKDRGIGEQREAGTGKRFWTGIGLRKSANL